MRTICRISVMPLCLGLAISCFAGCGKTPEGTGGQVNVVGTKTPGRPTGAPVGGTSVDNSEQEKLMAETVRLVHTRKGGSSERIPEDMPVYTDAKIGDMMETAEPASLVVLLQTSDPIDKVAAFYKEQCPAAGWTQASHIGDPDGAVMQLISYTKDDQKLSVAIVKNPAENVVDITMTSAKLDATQPGSTSTMTAYYPAQHRQTSSTDAKTDTP